MVRVLVALPRQGAIALPPAWAEAGHAQARNH
jgi:hypothetical protein